MSKFEFSKEKKEEIIEALEGFLYALDNPLVDNHEAPYGYGLLDLDEETQAHIIIAKKQIMKNILDDIREKTINK